MGSLLIRERKTYATLNNCAFVSTAPFGPDPFTFLMEASMLGVGVGFDTRGAAEGFHLPASAPSPPQLQLVEVADSREGWVDALRALLCHHFYPGVPYPVFDLSQIRPAGAPIRGFGGVSGGPGPLKVLLEKVDLLLRSRRGTGVDSRLITDLANLIGVCVVSGNVRRTAEIALGGLYDQDFLQLKNYTLNPERREFGWVSNNSVLVGMNNNAPLGYEHLAEGICHNGEPGLVWLDTSRSHGRLADPPNWRDWKAAGTNPCGEQTLESHELCCLVETFPHHHTNLRSYLKTLELAWFYGKVASLGGTPWVKTNEVTRRNRRLGISMSGVAQFVAARGHDTLTEWCDTGYHVLKRLDRDNSELWSVTPSIKLTSVKPSGTVSILAGASPGLHAPVDHHYLRRVRLPVNSPLLPPLREAGYHLEAAVGEEGKTEVVSIPCEAPGPAPRQSDLTLKEQLDLAILLQKYWADNAVSCTATFDPAKYGPEEVTQAILYCDGKLKGISFLPQPKDGEAAYPQMPYSPLTPAGYHFLRHGLKEVDWSSVVGKGLEEVRVEEYCDGASCSINLEGTSWEGKMGA
jgi:adenosylcobalamin-dependent ribonucleoside-triphosphate reductase